MTSKVDSVLQQYKPKILKWISSGGGSLFAPIAPSYVTLAADSTLPNERVLAVSGTGMTLVDSGAGLAVTVTLTSSSNPGAAEAILASTAAGVLTLVGLGFGANSAPTSTVVLSLDGQATRTITLERNVNANAVGSTLIVRSGGATSGATNKAGGTLSLRSGISTGSGASRILFVSHIAPITGVVATVSINLGGSGYTTGDVLTVTGGGGNCTLTVTATAGVVTGVVIVSGGTGYTPAPSVATTVAPAGGTGCEINTLTIVALAATSDTAATVIGTMIEGRKFFFGGVSTPSYTLHITMPTDYIDVPTGSERTVYIQGQAYYDTSTESTYGIYLAHNIGAITPGTKGTHATIAIVSTIHPSNVGTMVAILANNAVIASGAGAAGAVTTIYNYRAGTTGSAFTTLIETMYGYDFLNPTFSNLIAADQITDLVAYSVQALTKGQNISGLYITSITGGGGGWTAGANYGVYVGDVTGGATNQSILTNAGNAIFNEGGDASSDFRVESDTEANMIFLDANGDTDGILYLGGSTTGMKINKGGDIYGIGDGSGLPYGSVYGNEIGWSQALAAENTWYLVADADMADGELNLVTHDGNGKLTVTKAGRYIIVYDITVECSVANKHVQAGIAISGTTGLPGQSHFDPPLANAELTLGGNAIIDLAANATIEVAVRTTDTGTPNLAVDHLNISICQFGGT